MKKIIFFLLVTIFFSGCKSSTIIINDKYKDKDFSQKKILLLPFTDDVITVLNKDDVTDDFEYDKRDPEVVIKDALYKTMYDNSSFLTRKVSFLKTDSINAPFTTQQNESNFFTIEKQLGKDTTVYKFYIPKKESLLSNNLDTDIVIVIKKVFFGRNYSPGAMHYIPGQTIKTPGGSFTTPGAFSGGSTEFLSSDFDFVIYDYNENDVITFGRSSVKTDFLFAMAKSTWDDVFFKIAKEIYRSAPFYTFR